MTTLTQPLKEEHKELYPELETLRLAGDAMKEAVTASDRKKIDKAPTFLIHRLLPHAQAEEKALYPVVQKLMGSSSATATMSQDHMEVRRLTDELASFRLQIQDAVLTAEQVNSFRRVLYGLYTLVKVHFSKDEEVYLPLLDSQLKPKEAEIMFAAMEQAARQAKSHLL